MAEQKIASIITGGGRGIGRAVALRLERDTNIIVVGRTEADLASVCREISAGGGQAAYLVGDVSDQATAERAVALAEEKKWQIKNLICNAGIGKSGPTESFDPEVWRQIMAVNINGAFYFVRACLPAMLGQGGGNICLMSSIAGLKGFARSAAYDTGKHALVGFARSLAVEHGHRGIVAVPICPGFVEGEMTDRTIRGLMSRRGITESEARERVARQNPQRRILPAAEVAEAVAFVCAGKVPALSGHPLVLSGGE
ncbi:hypothetical protein A3C96_00240 [Candidatus Uhrbacteria bacterium RIFCSPHIGHO2_02_FULL_60_10]|uniref:Ketoreductase domain-containing protein n=1 Tax=Candidatus Uhrbacteria bacterium RIFCSPHIGHO2_02_FULL_60_10 TaxID=1802392 RepID=A0A1F7U5S1_9BACT|nr:MAG: hypothetical protein A3C96_00240 [Candidatus Uhrbacteria bacterium RIFCSPHIGHO2_02_FULL_60_10]